MNSFVKSIILARVKEKKYQEAMNIIKKMPKTYEIINKEEKPKPQDKIVIKKEPVEIKVPTPIQLTPKIPEPKIITPKPLILQTSKPEETYQPKQDSEIHTQGYTKINLEDQTISYQTEKEDIKKEVIPKPEEEFGIITELLKDPKILEISLNNGKLEVTTNEGKKDHGTISNQEAKDIINTFAKKSNSEFKPIFEAELKDHKISSVVSEVLGVRFNIKRI